MRCAVLALALAAAASMQRPAAAAAALVTGLQWCTPLQSTMALWAVAAAAQPAAAGSPLDAFMATSGGAAEAAPSLGGKFHGEYNKAIVDLFAKRAGLRKSVPPDVLGPFVEAAAQRNSAVDDHTQAAWTEWMETLQQELHAAAEEMVSPAAAEVPVQRPGEGDAAFKHRTRQANIDREYAKKIYAEPTVPSPTDGEPRAHIVKDYAELMDFIGSEGFMRSYFERRPLLITRSPEQARAANGEGAAEAPAEPLQPLLNFEFKLAKELGAFPDFVYSMSNTFWHHRNVKVAQGGFHRFSKQFSDNDRLTPKEIFRQLKKGATVFFNGVQHWSPSVAGLNLQLAQTFSHLANINMYVTAGGVSKSMSAHNDIQCTFVFQLEGVKRWRLWPKPSLMNALFSNDRSVGDQLVMGKTENSQLVPGQLGEPYMDVTLRPGDVLYIPRGVIHATSTPGTRGSSSDRSSHLTAGIDSFHGLNNAAILGAKMGWLANTKNHTFVHNHLPGLLPKTCWGGGAAGSGGGEDCSARKTWRGPTVCPNGEQVCSTREKVETLQQAFDGMLGLEPPPGCTTAACAKRRAEAGERPRSAGAAAALCTEPEGKHYLVDVLCEMGRGMHAWQAMAAVFADPRAVPSEDDWTRALLRGDARDPRLDVWRDPPKTAFEYTLLQSDEDNPLVRPLHSVLSKTRLRLAADEEAFAQSPVAKREGNPLGPEWQQGRLAELVYTLSHDFWCDETDYAEFIPILQASMPTDVRRAQARTALAHGGLTGIVVDRSRTRGTMKGRRRQAKRRKRKRTARPRPRKRCVATITAMPSCHCRRMNRRRASRAGEEAASAEEACGGRRAVRPMHRSLRGCARRCMANTVIHHYTPTPTPTPTHCPAPCAATASRRYSASVRKLFSSCRCCS